MVVLTHMQRMAAIQNAFYSVKKSALTPICPALADAVYMNSGVNIDYADVMCNFPLLRAYQPAIADQYPFWPLNERGQQARLEVLSELYANC